jgi:hypothetical protein
MNPLKRWTDIHIALFEQRILLLSLAVSALVLVVSDRITIHDLESKLREKEYILAPGLTDFAKVTPGIISKDYVKEFAESIAVSLGSFSASEVERRYKDLEKYLAGDFRIKFREKTKKDLSLFATNDIAETFSVKTTEILESKIGFEANVFGTQTRYVSGLKVFESAHVITFSLKAVAPSANSPWALEIQDISRLSEDEFRKQQRSVK